MQSHNLNKGLQVIEKHLEATNLDEQKQQLIGDNGMWYSFLIDHQPDLKTKFDYGNKQGSRYPYSNEWMPHFKNWAIQAIGIDINIKTEKQQDMEIDDPILNHEFLQELGTQNFSRRSFLKWERIMHSHGESLKEAYSLRSGKFERVVDMKLVKLANSHNIVLVPYGGGTNVTNSLELSKAEKRMIVSVDMTRMKKIKWIDRVNMSACIEAGIYGADLENELKKQGFMVGHEPDSLEFSTLGGWISTRASGMKKNMYGNIEDIVQNIKFVTSKGTYTKTNNWPRISNGPDLNHIVLGHEGNFGIVTEAVLRIRTLPQVKKFGSIIFPDFELGVKFMDQVARTRLWPASIRLVDNLQFQFSQALKTSSSSITQDITDSLKKFYVLQVKGFDQNKMSACTIAYEGGREEVEAQEQNIARIARKFNGMLTGEENGLRGYSLTFMIAYLRDFGCSYNFVAESIETSCAWSQVNILCKSIKETLIKSSESRGIPVNKIFASFRVTQLYETGAAVYIYFGFSYGDMQIKKVVQMYEEIENEARDEILRNGGSISHHHGVGKIRKRFSEKTMPPMAIDIMRNFKDIIDPKNVFAVNNTIYQNEEERQNDLTHKL
ncbi:alkyldihydroxyacetonephosphate peroxisomal [Stylonychia lemnae]|uniref:Alkylglycerone-phosphate synthase n=1 Tax=Stylonychia lemnae TaxID=5949 RepID=A0A077ZVV7_STYLE|nr:alkyldihydroxyacetonephosphate peroxisomal [Stylonychia lemnae]|eukprot:CDW72571.1 alkyldihydroxyacetonephosphate peroxisomal [Stylonychia lemnae]